MRPRSLWGLAGAVIFSIGSVLPSLVPRSAPIQGLLLGACAALGYGAGVMLGHLFGKDGAPGWRALTVASVITLGALVMGWVWQRDLASLTATPPPAVGWVFVAFVAGALILGILLWVARGVRGLTARLARGLQRLIGPRWASGVAVAVAVVAGVLIIANLPAAAAAIFRPVFEKMNASTPSGMNPPTSRYVSGGPASQIPWAALGSQGRSFVATVTPDNTLSDFSSRPAASPIRVFVGVDSASTDEGRAQMAVAELERFGAFDRSVIAVGTSAGSGTVDPGLVVPLEYLFDGDVATVSTQYSILPSFLSIMVDQQNSIQATRSLLDAIDARMQQVPARERPALVVFGESLGAYGANGAFSDLDALLGQSQGALFEGPPNSTAMWRSLTAQRQPGSPEIRPIHDEGRHVRWANQPPDLASPAGPFQDPRVVYLQNASDPVVWWSPRVLWMRPDWLAEPRGPGVLPWLPWLPVFTFSGLTGDMINSQGVPAGHGHVYGTDPAAAWADILRPPGWTAADTQRLQERLGG